MQVDRDKYKKARNLASKAIECEYQNQLKAVIGDVKSNPRNFYCFVESRKTDPIGISSLKSNEKILTNDGDKANCLNAYFSPVFTTEDDKEFPILSASHPNMLDIEV